MFRSILLILTILSFDLAAQNQKGENSPQLNSKNIKQIISAMTLEEKVNLVAAPGMKSAINKPVIGSVGGQVPGAAGFTDDILRLGIPKTVLADGPAGVRIYPTREGDKTKTYYATAWPVGTLLASSWDLNLVKKVGAAMGNEVREYGIDILLAPGMNIQRDPLNGRNFEYYSEDPYLTGYMATAMVNGIQSNGVGTSIKHFVVNNQESNRDKVNVIVSERALREIYLKGFEIAVKNSHPWTVMSSYNKVNGTYTSQSYDLLTKILRNEWGFKGYVMSDWFGGDDVAAQMNAGNNLIEPGGRMKRLAILDALKNGTLTEKQLDKNIEDILAIIVNTPTYIKYKRTDAPDLKGHAVIARNAASESMVLLKNESASLPLKKTKRIALFGTASYNTYIGGTGSGDVYEPYTVSVSKGLSNAGYLVNDILNKLYTTHIQQDKIAFPDSKTVTLGVPRIVPELSITTEQIEKIAEETDVAIFTIGRNAGEGADRPIDENFNLSKQENELISQISSIFHVKGKKLIVLINTGGTIETASWKNYADAILLTWQPGEEAGNAIADVLSGTVNPSGKLATTFPVKYKDVPSSKNFPGTPVEKPQEVIYEEGIYVGYRYFNTFRVNTSYPFGFGLSYTTFAYSNLNLSSAIFNGSIKASVTITNTGKVAGKEVVQLYLSAPTNKIDKPSEELKGFAKTKLLNSGESQTLTFTLNAKDLASFNTEPTAWIADAGKYTLKIAASSEDIRLSKTFSLNKDIVVERVNKALVPQVTIKELTSK